MVLHPAECGGQSRPNLLVQAAAPMSQAVPSLTRVTVVVSCFSVGDSSGAAGILSGVGLKAAPCHFILGSWSQKAAAVLLKTVQLVNRPTINK